ncbi:hypothetical protein B0T10DRAFT_454727 [Thelonectria olida]|uniref:Uncharacterized protein n=1 Tax=Thelonectria olida TaxID=1576542 RepID=A0A9P8WEK3_9HYPO|nr:hypothetical protein B0T10DRAFT_454727 [Thelonectria olida]
MARSLWEMFRNIGLSMATTRKTGRAALVNAPSSVGAPAFIEGHHTDVAPAALLSPPLFTTRVPTPTPVEQNPPEPAPVEHTFYESFLSQCPFDQAPVQEAPVQEAPVQEAPVEEAPVEKAPVVKAPVEKAPVEKAPVQHAPVQQAIPLHAPVPVHVPVRPYPIVHDDNFINAACSNGIKYAFVQMVLVPTNNEDWVASLVVRTHNMPILMRQGLYWGEANLQLSRAHFQFAGDQGFQRAPVEGSWTHCRVYRLIDLEYGLWNADLRVYSYDIQPLADFSVGDISRDNIWLAVGRNEKQERIYNYSRDRPDQNFNAYFDDMPLEGWWPWPKDDELE